jgi:hypothetical protein
MLRAAIRAPARATWQSTPRCGEQTTRAPVRRSCQLSRPSRAAEPPKGDGISFEVEYSGLWGQLATFPKRKPFMTNLIVATVKTSAADFVVQAGQGKDLKDMDFKRNAVFTVFGFLYLGVAQWFIYVTVFKTLCPHAVRFANLSWAEKLKDKAGQKDLVKQVCLDNFVHYTFIYFPVFYTFKESIQGDGINADMVSNAMAKYKENIVKDNLAMWALWIPFDVIIYAVPIWMRLPLNHSVSFAWTMILSWMRGG